MTPEQQQIAIAKACGWTSINFRYADNQRCIISGTNPSPDKGDNSGLCYILPDYIHDLNAMNKAEKVLTVAQRITYARHIGVVLSGGSVGRAIPNWWFIHEANAAQRAEAFLRTLNLWES